MCGNVAYNVYCVAKRGRSWKRALKNVVDNAATVGMGQLVGCGISIVLAPVTGGWSLMFGALGGVFTVLGCNAAMDKQTCKWFELPQDEYLEKAYNVLECQMSDPNDKLGYEYRQKSRRYHPDKCTGDKAQREENRVKFLKVQAALTMIMADREDDKDTYKQARDDFQKLEEKELLKSKEFLHRVSKWWTWLASKFNTNVTQIKRNLPAIPILPYKCFEESAENDSTVKLEVVNDDLETAKTPAA